MVADVIKVTPKEWKPSNLDSVISRGELKAIRAIPLPMNDVKDRRVWWPNNKGIYTVKSGYMLGCKVTLEQPEVSSSVSPPPKVMDVHLEYEGSPQGQTFLVESLPQCPCHTGELFQEEVCFIALLPIM